MLAVDIGGTHVKILASRRRTRRRAESGPEMTAKDMVEAVKTLAEGWPYDAVTLGYPGPVLHNKPLIEPANLGPGWCGFDFESAFGTPVRIINDALMQAIGSYEGGRMLFLGLGTGLGTALVVGNVAQPLELAHLPYKKGRTFEDYVGLAGLKRLGKKKWRKEVDKVVAQLQAALEPDYVVIGGGNLKKLGALAARMPGRRQRQRLQGRVSGLARRRDSGLTDSQPKGSSSRALSTKYRGPQTEVSAMSYESIDNYGMIGDMHTIALVSIKGSIDWMCMPRFDSPSVFAALLDDEKGGCFSITPDDDDVTCKQFYLARHQRAGHPLSVDPGGGGADRFHAGRRPRVRRPPAPRTDPTNHRGPWQDRIHHGLQAGLQFRPRSARRFASRKRRDLSFEGS